jgi:hypothetical protein
MLIFDTVFLGGGFGKTFPRAAPWVGMDGDWQGCEGLLGSLKNLGKDSSAIKSTEGLLRAHGAGVNLNGCERSAASYSVSLEVSACSWKNLSNSWRNNAGWSWLPLLLWVLKRCDETRWLIWHLFVIAVICNEKLMSQRSCLNSLTNMYRNVWLPISELFLQ